MIPHYSKQLESLEQRYIAAHPRSMKAIDEASQWLPGGNTRTVLHYDPFPLVITQGQGSRVTDIDGLEYLDCVGEFSAGLYGHQQTKIHQALEQALKNGLTLGGPNLWEARLAEAVCSRFDSISKVRFCNSGTEANLFALVTARAYTGRNTIVVFDGAYHGGVMTFSGGGSPMNVPFDYIVLPYNDSAEARKLFSDKGTGIAAVLVEPILGAAGNIPGTDDFLATLREQTSQHGSLLIFDEVKTSRCGPAGVQGLRGIVPDMTTLGKYLGGGLPLGAFGGKQQIMERFDPRLKQGLKHAGTFNNNVLSMSAGLTGLTKIYTSERAQQFHEETEAFKARLEERLQDSGLPICLTGHGSMFTFHYGDKKPSRASDVTDTSVALRRLLYLRCIELGIRLAGRGDVYLSLAMTQADLQELSDKLLQAATDVLAQSADVSLKASMASPRP